VGALAVAAAARPPEDPEATLRAIRAIESPDPRERLAALRALFGTRDPRALGPLLALARTPGEDPALREETWMRIAMVAWSIAREHEIDPALVAFLREIAARPPEVLVLSTLHEHRTRVPKYDYPRRARHVLELVDRRAARRALQAELAALPETERAAHLAEVAWLSAGEADPHRRSSARELLAALGSAGTEASRARIGRAPPEGQQALAAYFQKLHRVDAEGAAAGLLELAAVPDPIAAGAALHALYELRPPGAAEPLVRLLESPGFPEERIDSGLHVLAALGDEAAVEFASRALHLGRGETRAYAARVLARLGDAGLERLLAASESKLREERTAAAFALAEIDHPDAREAVWKLAERTRRGALRAVLLERTVATPELPTPTGVGRGGRRARIAAIDRLGYEPGKDSLAALSALLAAEPQGAAEREETWLHAARALRPVAARVAVPDPLLERLRALAAREASVRGFVLAGGLLPRRGLRFPYPAAAAQALCIAELARPRPPLGEIAAALPASDSVELLAALAWGEPGFGTTLPRRAASELLAEAGPAGLPATLAALERAPEEARGEMVAYLQQVYEATDDPRAIEGLLRLTTAREWSVWRSALEALGRGDAPDLAPALIERLAAHSLDVEDDFAEQAFETLGRLEDERAIPFLVEQLSHRDARAAREAAHALARLGERRCDAGCEALIEGSRSEEARRRQASVAALVRLEGSRRARRAVRHALRAHPEDLESELLSWMRQGPGRRAP
jgi:HEAT repeat protein